MANASASQASTSATAALARASCPTGVAVRPESLRMRASTGIAVMPMAAARNIANGQNATPGGAKRACRLGAISRPKAIGSSTASTPTAPAARSERREPAGRRSSAPTISMNSTRPSWLNASSAGSVSAANSHCCHCGASAPSRIGPSARPASISPITRGCPSQRNTHASALDAVNITTSCNNNTAFSPELQTTACWSRTIVGATRERR